MTHNDAMATLMTVGALDDAMATLRDAIFNAYICFARSEPLHGSERARRQTALEDIEEFLDGHPLTTFSATHLELLSLMIAYWREAEVEAGAPEPDPLQ